MEDKCVYCNSTNVSISDIIPESLTNAKITKKNVCEIEHNNKFGETFESDVINGLSSLRDYLNIKKKKRGKKGGQYPGTKIQLRMGNHIAYKKNYTKYVDPVPDYLKKSDRNIDLKKELKIIFPINTNSFISLSSKRLMAKMAYEWYCMHNSINGYHKQFGKVVNFICTGEGEEVVKYVENEELYNFIEEDFLTGSHVFLCYIAPNNSVNILISFFGICIYNVRILDYFSDHFKNNVIIQEFQVTGDKKVLNLENLNMLGETLMQHAYEISLDSKEIRMGKAVTETNLNDLILAYLKFLKFPESGIKFMENFDELESRVLNNYQRVFNEGIIHLGALKRFVEEVLNNFSPSLLRNLFEESNLNNVFYLYVLYLVGKHPLPEPINSKDINSLLRSINETEIIINDNYIKEIEKTIMLDFNYVKVIEDGILKIKK